MPHQHFILPLTCATPNSTSAILKHILIPTPKLSRPLYTLFPVLARNSRVFDFSHLKEKKPGHAYFCELHVWSEILLSSTERSYLATHSTSSPGTTFEI